MKNQTIDPQENATIEDRHPENADGPWWVSDECIDCGMCYELAPDSFKRTTDFTQAIVFHQPETEAERSAAEEAMAECPVEAIERDG